MDICIIIYYIIYYYVLYTCIIYISHSALLTSNAVFLRMLDPHAPLLLGWENASWSQLAVLKLTCPVFQWITVLRSTVFSFFLQRCWLHVSLCRLLVVRSYWLMFCGEWVPLALVLLSVWPCDLVLLSSCSGLKWRFLEIQNLGPHRCCCSSRYS